MSVFDRIRSLVGVEDPATRGEHPGVVTDLAGATHRPFVLSPELRARMATRIQVAVPTGPDDLADIDRRKRIEGLPVDVLITLEGLAMLAERGNLLAAELLVEERRKLGIDRRTYSTKG